MNSSHLQAFNAPTTELWSGNDHGLPTLPEETLKRLDSVERAGSQEGKGGQEGEGEWEGGGVEGGDRGQGRVVKEGEEISFHWI